MGPEAKCTCQHNSDARRQILHASEAALGHGIGSAPIHTDNQTLIPIYVCSATPRMLVEYGWNTKGQCTSGLGPEAKAGTLLRDR